MFKQNLFSKVLLLMLMFIGVHASVFADEQTVTYTFTDKAWSTSEKVWTSGKDGAGFSNGGVQVTTNATGANATSKNSFSNVSKIVVTYATNKSQGTGSVELKIGENTAVSNSVSYPGTGEGNKQNYTTQFDYSTPQSGNIKLTVYCTTNSIYVKSIAITYDDGVAAKTPIATIGDLAPTTLEVNAEGTFTLPIEYASTDATGYETTWLSDNEDVILVDNSGEYLTSTPGTANITVTVTPVDDATYSEVSKTFEVTVLPAMHIAHFSINGEIDEANDCSVREGSAIEFPENIADINGKTFYGWATTTIEGVADTAPEVVTSANMGTEDVTYYAVFANMEGTMTTTVDVLDHALIGIEGTNYTDFDSITDKSDAVYAGQSAGGNSSIQLRSSNNNSGIVTTASGGKLTKIAVEWNYNTAATRTITIYGSNSPYTDATDVYNVSKRGTNLGQLEYDGNNKNTELVIDGDYTYFGIRSKSGALYLSKIEVTWENGNATYSNFCTTVPDVAAVAVEIGAAGAATFSSTEALDFTEVTTVAAYIAKEATSGNSALEFTRVYKVPANTGLIVRNAAGENAGAVSADVPVLAGEADNVEGNLFVAATEEIASLPSVDGEYT
ncbi:MAG: hypothetical protein IJV23_04825, partial [Prevotella sp.]|nr:hypothetical protein [Prevotella sp.]